MLNTRELGIAVAFFVGCSGGTLQAQSTYEPYSFTTLAGGAEVGSTDGDGTVARFHSPTGVSRDGAGNLYVADSQNHTIRKIDPSGIVSTWAGMAGLQGTADGTGNTARFNRPLGVAAAVDGTLYVTDTDNSSIRKITPARVVTTFAGLSGTPGSDDGNGNSARFRFPSHLAVDSSNFVYVADYGNHTIRKIAPDRTVTTLAGSPGMFGSLDGNGSAARFHHPAGVAVDTTGNLYVADQVNSTIRKIALPNTVSTFAGLAGMSGSADGPGDTARFSLPTDVAVDGSGRVYVADTLNQLVRRITPARLVTTLAGLPGANAFNDGIGSNVRFNFPVGVTVDGNGKVYVADQTNNRIRAGQPAVVTVVGVTSNKTHGGAGEFTIPLPAGTESRSGGVNSNHAIVFTFANTLTSVGGATVTSGTGTVASSGVGVDAHQYIVNLTGVGNAQTITVSLTNVADSAGNFSPTVAVSMGVLLGDSNGDRFVNAGDTLQTRSRSGQTTNGANFRSDVNVDGLINSGDTLSVRSRSGTFIP